MEEQQALGPVMSMYLRRRWQETATVAVTCPASPSPSDSVPDAWSPLRSYRGVESLKFEVWVGVRLFKESYKSRMTGIILGSL